MKLSIFWKSRLTPALMGLAMLTLAPELAGQEPPKEKEKEPEPAKLALIALGPIAKTRYRSLTKAEMNTDGIDDDRIPDSPGDLKIAMAFAEHETPPSNLKVIPEIKDKERGEAAVSQIRVGFNRSTGLSTLPPGVPLAVGKTSRDAKGKVKMDTWLKIKPLAPGSKIIAFLFGTGSKREPWKGTPKVEVLDVGDQNFPKLHYRIANFAKQTVAVSFDNKQYTLVKPNASVILKIPPNQKYLNLFAIDPRTKSRISNRSLRVRSQTRALTAFYSADPATNAGKAVGTVHVNIPD